MASRMCVFLLSTMFGLLIEPIVSADTLINNEVECSPWLLLLATCGPFIQGYTPSPLQLCCNNLADLASQEPHCLCVLINETGSFSINRTLALKLPHLCDITPSVPSCPGLSHQQPDFLQTSNKSSANADPPAMESPPRTGFSFGHSSVANAETLGAIQALIATIYLPFFFYIIK